MKTRLLLIASVLALACLIVRAQVIVTPTPVPSATPGRPGGTPEIQVPPGDPWKIPKPPANPTPTPSPH